MKVSIIKHKDEKTGKIRYQAFAKYPMTGHSGWHDTERAAIRELESLLRQRGVR